MRTIVKYATVMALTGMLALAAASPSEARNGRNAAAAIGFGVGAVAGAAIASSAYNGGYYGYYGDPGYGYAYAPGYAYDSYAYEPGYAYVAPSYDYYTAGTGRVSTVPTTSRSSRSVKLRRSREGEGSLFGATSFFGTGGPTPLISVQAGVQISCTLEFQGVGSRLSLGRTAAMDAASAPGDRARLVK